MAAARLLLTIAALLSLTTLQVVYGGIVCEKLPAEICAFSVSPSGARCVLQKSILKDGNAKYECQTSEVMAEALNELIETEECMKACGVERMTVGMSAEPLAEGVFTEKLCCPNCYNNCPNIVDFYFNAAAAIGVYLPSLCEANGSGDRRMIIEAAILPALPIPPLPSIPELPIPPLPKLPPLPIPPLPIPSLPIPLTPPLSP